MGCTSSNSSGSAATEGKTAAEKKEEPTWKLFPDVDETRDRYIQDGTLEPQLSTAFHIEFRYLLEEPIAKKLLTEFAKRYELNNLLTLWQEIQSLSSLSPKYKTKLCELIYTQYIENCPEEIANLVVMDPDGRKICEEAFEQLYYSGGAVSVAEEGNQSSLLPILTQYKIYQRKVFYVLFNNLFSPFRVGEGYRTIYKLYRHNYNQVLPDDFEYLSKLGSGSFGVVLKCRKKSTGVLYAMKVQRKLGLLDHYDDEPWRVNDEKKAYAICHHPFIVEFAYALQTDSMVMIVMSLCGAGELRSICMKQPDQRIDHEHVHFYVAEIVSALSYLHSIGLIYRDLKPGNLLLHTDGHIQLADLGGVVDVSGDTLTQYEEYSTPPIFNQFPKVSERVKRRKGSNNSSAHHSRSNSLRGGGSVGNDSSFRSNGEGSISLHFEASHDQNETSQSRKNRDGTDMVSTFDNSGLVEGGEGSLRKPDMHDEVAVDEDVAEGVDLGEEEQYRAALINKRAQSVVGTEGYMAPEIMIALRQRGRRPKGYSYCVDWWSLGATTYKLYTGIRPFSSSSQVYGHVTQQPSHSRNDKGNNNNSDNINGEGEKSVSTRKHVSPLGEIYFECGMMPLEAENFILALLDFNPKTRLGSGPLSSLEVMKHPYLQDVDFTVLESKGYTPPPIPTIPNNKSETKGPASGGASAKSRMSAGNDSQAQMESMRTTGTEQEGKSFVEIMKALGFGSWVVDDDQLNFGMRGRDTTSSWASYLPMHMNEFFDHWNCVAPDVIRLEMAAECKSKGLEGDSNSRV